MNTVPNTFIFYYYNIMIKLFLTSTLLPSSSTSLSKYSQEYCFSQSLFRPILCFPLGCFLRIVGTCSCFSGVPLFVRSGGQVISLESGVFSDCCWLLLKSEFRGHKKMDWEKLQRCRAYYICI